MGEQLWLPDNSFAFSFMACIKIPRKHARTHARTHTYTHTHRPSPTQWILTGIAFHRFFRDSRRILYNHPDMPSLVYVAKLLLQGQKSRLKRGGGEISKGPSSPPIPPAAVEANSGGNVIPCRFYTTMSPLKASVITPRWGRAAGLPFAYPKQAQSSVVKSGFLHGSFFTARFCITIFCSFLSKL